MTLPTAEVATESGLLAPAEAAGSEADVPLERFS